MLNLRRIEHHIQKKEGKKGQGLARTRQVTTAETHRVLHPDDDDEQ